MNLDLPSYETVLQAFYDLQLFFAAIKEGLAAYSQLVGKSETTVSIILH